MITQLFHIYFGLDHAQNPIQLKSKTEKAETVALSDIFQKTTAPAW